MKITPISLISKPQIKYENKITNTKNDDTAGSVGYNSIPYYNTISFQARVDKGLKRFYEVNKDRMPRTLRTFIDKLPDKEMLTPLDANKLAFSALAGITTVAGLKLAFPDEELVQDVKDIDETKATRGVLSTYRQNKDLFDKDSLVNGENLSIWLVKKVLLESKTIDEINDDFIKEVDPDFYGFYRESEPEGQPVRHSTLSALGIKMPEKEYMTSLRYTREGYSDTMSAILTIAQQDAWARLSEPEKLARATKFVLATDKWWDSIPQDVKLDILASQNAELELLKLYNERKKEKAEKQEMREKQQNATQAEKTSYKERIYPKEHIDTGIKRDDELFKAWLQNNLAIKREQLTLAEKREITIRQQQRRAENWEAMSVEEQIEYISRMKSGSEQLRFAMIDTWNNNPDILIKLSIYLKKQNIEKPVDVLYGSKEFNSFQSKIMKDFWALYPEFSIKLGQSIKEAHQKIKDAKKSDSFEMLKTDILLARAEREDYVKTYLKNYREILTEKEYESYPEYVKEFINVYSENGMEYNKHMPLQYLKDFFNTVNEELSVDIIESWTKSLKGENLTKEDELNIEQVRQFEPPKAQIMNRAIEAAAADILYECTDDPHVYMMSQTDCKVALSQIDRGYEQIVLSSAKTGKDFVINIKNYNIDDKKMEKLYDYYKEPKNKITDIIPSYFRPITDLPIPPSVSEKLEEYILSYGKSIDKIFSLDSKMPLAAKNAFLQKFLFNLPMEVSTFFECKLKNIKDLEKDEQINRINNKLIRKYNFIPQEMLNAYLFEINQTLRNSSVSSLDNFEEVCCKPRKTPQERGKIAILRREQLTDRGNLFTFLCIEQVLADVLYKATNEPKVYSLNFEELIDNFEVFSLVKRYPSENRYINPNNTKEEFQVKLLRKLPLYYLNRQTAEYVQELQNYVKECINEDKPLDKEEILFILNTDENLPEVDKATMSRIEPIFEQLQSIVEISRKGYHQP